MAYVYLPIDVTDLDRVISGADKRVQLSDAELQEIGDRALHMIQRRTGRGVDHKGDKFKAYSKRYADRRKKSGRNTDRVELLFEGHMRAAATATADRGAALLYFTSASEAQKAEWHNTGAGHLPERRWYDLDEDGDEALDLARMARDFMAERF